MPKIYYFACLSGGKDSSAMVDLLLKNGYPIDYIIFNDTLAEFSAMYEYLAKFNAHLKANYGREITISRPYRYLCLIYSYFPLILKFKSDSLSPHASGAHFATYANSISHDAVILGALSSLCS
ncbi:MULTISPECIES: phosphoadenosine phosphosulfate reductase domain-containing protein [unclassified Campylobacter]|uniref:phosphoadenosine phosphosulfate reductase domain-containing protein n=1 Tax=unclassified Campylobacter TaxID=2593542 RepID=UPI0022E9F4F3|nr:MULTISPECIES: phosphoadenosine phosphosulfate reductase family protein [unclassified Campylobacter]MDA3061640.1 phosphoadenosine phosphosulfate reductase family protein [Campylobacter sp. JMF_14 EL1]MDA3073254.1 phosphoadenosine phosphosulfate reductase family protein [Campylobacter sp. JMF_10 EL2]